MCRQGHPLFRRAIHLRRHVTILLRNHRLHRLTTLQLSRLHRRLRHLHRRLSRLHLLSLRAISGSVPILGGAAAGSNKKSPKRKRSPLPKVPHQNMKKLPGEMTSEELEVSAKMTYEKWKIDVATKKKPIEPLFPRSPEDHAACAKLKKNLHNPIPLTSD